MTKVQLRENLRYFEQDDTDFTIISGQTKELPEKYLRSYSIKNFLFTGRLLVVEGEFLFNFKNSKIYVTKDLLYGKEFGKSKIGMTSPIMDTTTATPPMRGMGLEWILRIPGTSTICSFLAIRIIALFFGIRLIRLLYDIINAGSLRTAIQLLSMRRYLRF